MAGPLTTPERIDVTILELHARVCKTMAHPVRLALLNAMRHGEMSVGEPDRRPRTRRAQPELGRRKTWRW